MRELNVHFTGLVSDLAQVPHKLDLSSPHMALTINMCLKPLEVLTRLIYSVCLFV